MRNNPHHMQNRSYANKTIVRNSSPAHNSQSSPSPLKDDLTRIFNTALLSTKAGAKRDFSSELYEITESASFKAILNAVRQLARAQGVHERQAAEQIVRTFRKMDEIWNEYVFREGLDKLRGPRNNS